MSKLTHGDIQTIATFFASPAGVRFAADIAAQSYEPRGAGYQPSTDTRLASLVLSSVRSVKSAWVQASLVVDQLCGRPGGGAHLDVLRWYGSGNRALVGSHTPRAMAYGRELAKDAARMSELESEYRACQYRGFSTYETTTRILDLEAKLRSRNIDVSLGAVLVHACDAVSDRLINVDAEIDALLEAAADALHAAQARVLEAQLQRSRREDERRSNLRAELAGKREAKEAARFARRLQAAS